MTRQAGWRHAPLPRKIADEIVVAVDATVDAKSIVDLQSPTGSSDSNFRATSSVGSLAWLHGLCSGDWILRLDGDEVVSPELVDELPSLIRESDVRVSSADAAPLAPSPDRWLDSGRGRRTTTTDLSATTRTSGFQACVTPGPSRRCPRAMSSCRSTTSTAFSMMSARELKVARYLALPPKRTPEPTVCSLSSTSLNDMRPAAGSRASTRSGSDRSGHRNRSRRRGRCVTFRS